MQYFVFPLSVLLLIASGRVVIAEGSTNAREANQYPAEFVRDYQQECMQTSLEEGLAEAEAKSLCSCTIDEFSRQYSLEEFKELTAASATDRASEATLIEVGQFCFEEILYAE